MAREGQEIPSGGAGGWARTVAAWRREASPLYQAMFASALLALGVSLAAGLVEAVRLFGLPPIGGDATILGRALLERGDYATALEEFRLAGVIDPENYAGAAPRLSFSREPIAPERLEPLRRMAQEYPGSAGAQLALGQALLAQGDLAASLQSLERARALAAHQPGLDATLGRAYLEAGRWAEAEGALRDALAAEPHPDLHLHLAFALHEQGKREEAARHFERARALRAQPGEQAP